MKNRSRPQIRNSSGLEGLASSMRCFKFRVGKKFDAPQRAANCSLNRGASSPACTLSSTGRGRAGRVKTTQKSMIRNFLLALCLFSAAHTAVCAEQLRLAWTNNLLTISAPWLPGGKIDVWYLEAFCRKGSTHQEWSKTVLPHKTELLWSEPDGSTLRLRTLVKPDIEMIHEIRAGVDEVDFTFQFTNRGKQHVDLEWFQPACIRVDRFTGAAQSNYTTKAFIFTRAGLTRLQGTRRTEEAIYRGGQVYVPKGVDLADVNPRPISLDQPVNGLIGCFSQDDKFLLATASDQTHELFEGVYVCLHSDPHVGGLAGGQSKVLHSKIYLLPNDVDALLKRYRKDFGAMR